MQAPTRRHWPHKKCYMVQRAPASVVDYLIRRTGLAPPNPMVDSNIRQLKLSEFRLIAAACFDCCGSSARDI
jgi:hypothetical protein